MQLVLPSQEKGIVVPGLTPASGSSPATYHRDDHSVLSG